MTDHWCQCMVCKRDGGGEVMVRISEIVEHLDKVHGITGGIAEWPDGEPVVIDRTLEPGDFE